MSYFCVELTSDCVLGVNPVGGENNRDSDAGRRPGRNTTFSTKAYADDDELAPIAPQDLLDSEMSGAAIVDPGIDGYHQPTAMFDKGEFLGELAEIVDGSPETRAKVEAEEAPPRGCRLIVVAGPDLGMEWAFKVPEITMGRDEDCELMMSDIAVSRRHAKITLEGEHFILSDLGSGNGTYLNGVRTEREELSPGDEITVGERTMRFVELNEAPPTAAAHPVPRDLPGEPVVGDPSLDDDGFAPIGGASQIDAEAASAVGPSLEAKKRPAGPKVAVEKPGAALRTFATAGGLVALLAALSFAGWMLYGHYVDGESEAMAMARAKREFLQGISLVKSKRCGDAMIMFHRVLAVRPGYEPAERYQAHCQKELGVWTELESARVMAQNGQYKNAIAALAKVDKNSHYAEDARQRSARYNQIIAERTVLKGRDRLDESDFDGAETLAEQALELVPGLRSALALQEDVAAAREGAKPKPRPKVKPTIPPILMRAVALYKNEQVGAAIDAAEAAGGDKADEYVKRMKRLKKILANAREAHQSKAAAELLRIVPAALELDKQIAFGEGKVRQRLQGYYADGLYLKGIEAYQAGDDAKAFKMLAGAVRAKPGHRLAETRLAELTGKAKTIYWEGYVQKDSDPAATRKIFRRVVQMTDDSNKWHKEAKKWLRTNPG